MAEVVEERPRLPVVAEEGQQLQLQLLVGVVVVAVGLQQLAPVLRPSGLQPPELDR